MISAKLCGGQGNQMFIIATCWALAARNRDTCIFSFQNCSTPLQGKPATNYRDTVFRNVKEGEFEPEAYYKEPDHTFRPIPYQKGLLIEGYYQTELYFNDMEDEIKQLFYLEDFRDKVGDLTAIHVRHGDYAKFPNIHPILPNSYYQKAMEIIGGKFLVFSDDIDWCRNNIVGNNIQYSESGDEVVDLSMMASCKNVIIANSSFSWWGAYLNKNKDCQIVAPKEWFGPAGPNSRDIIPKRWTIL